MPTRWIITTLGKDQPGIVAGVARILYQLGCNLEDSAMTRLEGEFAILLIFSAPARVKPERLARAFAPLERQFQLTVHVKRLSQAETTTPQGTGRVYLFSVYGADRPGIVYHVCDALAKAGVNITDVQTHRSTRQREREPSLYLMLLEAEVPARIPMPTLERTLQALARRLRVEVSLRPADPDVL